MNSIAKNNSDTLNADAKLDAEIQAWRLNMSIARALTEDEVLMAAIDLTANNAATTESAALIAINADQRPQDAHEIADVIRGIVATLVAAASISTLGHPIARIIDEADEAGIYYDPAEIAAEVAWSVTMI